MPSTILTDIPGLSGGALLVSGDVYSGTLYLGGGIQLKLAAGAPGIVYCGLPNLSGNYPTVTSGGSLSSGLSGFYLTDGMEMSPGDSYYIPKRRLVSGITTPRFVMAATSSGGRLFWEPLGLLVSIGLALIGSTIV